MRDGCTYELRAPRRTGVRYILSHPFLAHIPSPLHSLLPLAHSSHPSPLHPSLLPPHPFTPSLTSPHPSTRSLVTPSFYPLTQPPHPFTLSLTPAACVGLVAGATDIPALRAVRAAAPSIWILCPGVGAQGGDAQTVCSVGLRKFDGYGLLVSGTLPPNTTQHHYTSAPVHHSPLHHSPLHQSITTSPHHPPLHYYVFNYFEWPFLFCIPIFSPIGFVSESCPTPSLLLLRVSSYQHYREEASFIIMTKPVD